jgi:hypothetical protein
VRRSQCRLAKIFNFPPEPDHKPCVVLTLVPGLPAFLKLINERVPSMSRSESPAPAISVRRVWIDDVFAALPASWRLHGPAHLSLGENNRYFGGMPAARLQS